MPNLLRGGKGRPLHPALVHFPIALYPTSLLFDWLSHLADNGNAFVKGAFTLILVGLAVSVAAVVTGFADFLRIDAGSRTWKVAVTHMTLQLVAGGLFLANAILRARDLDVTVSAAGPIVLSGVGVAILAVGALLGGDLVYRHGQRVERPPVPLGEPREDPPSAREERTARS
ncbi:MAG TPA: DUF2231 domain-containing protein [Actinomycetes bacterium]|jgi:uncharacterized membrane protein|nr:DUF2231 domain-containing protein [Actinomycetes bacterium]